MTCHFVLPFVERQGHHASLVKTKRVLKKENLRLPHHAWKGYLKTWDW